MTTKTVVQQTKNYSRFVPHELNPDSRQPDHKLKASIEKRGWSDGSPMSVVRDGDKFKIIDGHRRFRAACELGLAVKFVVCNGEFDDFDPASFSALQKPWTVDDFVSSYCKRNVKDYLQLREFADKHGLMICTASVVLGCSANAAAVLKSGDFKVGDTETTNKCVRIMLAVRGADTRPRFSWWKSQRFAVAVLYVVKHVPQLDVAKMCSKLNTHQAKLSLQPVTVGYIEMLDEIYNYHFSVAKTPIYHLVESALAESGK